MSWGLVSFAGPGSLGFFVCFLPWCDGRPGVVSRALPLRDIKVTFACIFQFTIDMHSSV